MDFQKISEAIKNSPPQVKNLMFSDRLGGLIQDIAWEHGLDEDKALSLGDEAGYVILGLKSRFNFSDSLLSIGIDKNTAKEISDKIEKFVFSELDKIKTTDNKTEENIAIEKKSVQSNSYEQILINQAKAMRPVGVEETGSMNYESRIMGGEAPNNLPTGEIHHASLQNYRSGNDPYREPVEE